MIPVKNCEISVDQYLDCVSHLRGLKRKRVEETPYIKQVFENYALINPSYSANSSYMSDLRYDFLEAGHNIYCEARKVEHENLMQVECDLEASLLTVAKKIKLIKEDVLGKNSVKDSLEMVLGSLEFESGDFESSFNFLVDTLNEEYSKKQEPWHSRMMFKALVLFYDKLCQKNIELYRNIMSYQNRKNSELTSCFKQEQETLKKKLRENFADTYLIISILDSLIDQQSDNYLLPQEVLENHFYISLKKESLEDVHLEDLNPAQWAIVHLLIEAKEIRLDSILIIFEKFCRKNSLGDESVFEQIQDAFRSNDEILEKEFLLLKDLLTIKDKNNEILLLNDELIQFLVPLFSLWAKKDPDNFIIFITSPYASCPSMINHFNKAAILSPVLKTLAMTHPEKYVNLMPKIDNLNLLRGCHAQGLYEETISLLKDLSGTDFWFPLVTSLNSHGQSLFFTESILKANEDIVLNAFKHQKEDSYSLKISYIFEKKDGSGYKILEYPILRLLLKLKIEFSENVWIEIAQNRPDIFIPHFFTAEGQIKSTNPEFSKFFNNILSGLIKNEPEQFVSFVSWGFDAQKTLLHNQNTFDMIKPYIEGLSPGNYMQLVLKFDHISEREVPPSELLSQHFDNYVDKVFEKTIKDDSFKHLEESLFDRPHSCLFSEHFLTKYFYFLKNLLLEEPESLAKVLSQRIESFENRTVLHDPAVLNQMAPLFARTLELLLNAKDNNTHVKYEGILLTLSCVDNKGATPLHDRRVNDFSSRLLAFLFKNKNKCRFNKLFNELYIKPKFENESVLECLIKSKERPLIQDKSGNNLFHFINDLNERKAIIQGCKIDINTLKNHFGMSPLDHMALNEDYLRSFKGVIQQPITEEEYPQRIQNLIQEIDSLFEYLDFQQIPEAFLSVNKIVRTKEDIQGEVFKLLSEIKTKADVVGTPLQKQGESEDERALVLHQYYSEFIYSFESLINDLNKKNNSQESIGFLVQLASIKIEQRCMTAYSAELREQVSRIRQPDSTYKSQVFSSFKVVLEDTIRLFCQKNNIMNVHSIHNLMTAWGFADLEDKDGLYTVEQCFMALSSFLNGTNFVYEFKDKFQEESVEPYLKSKTPKNYDKVIKKKDVVCSFVMLQERAVVLESELYTRLKASLNSDFPMKSEQILKGIINYRGCSLTPLVKSASYLAGVGISKNTLECYAIDVLSKYKKVDSLFCEKIFFKAVDLKEEDENPLEKLAKEIAPGRIDQGKVLKDFSQLINLKESLESFDRLMKKLTIFDSLLKQKIMFAIDIYRKDLDNLGKTLSQEFNINQEEEVSPFDFSFNRQIHNSYLGAIEDARKLSYARSFISHHELSALLEILRINGIINVVRESLD